MLIHVDNFSYFGTDRTFMMSGVYSRVGTSQNVGAVPQLVADPDGVSSGKVLGMTATYGGNNNYQTCRYVLPGGAATTLGVALRIWCAALPHVANSFRPIQLLTGALGKIYYLNVTSTGVLQICNSSNTVLYATAAPVISAQGWYHLEWKSVIDAAVGVFEVRVEGITVITETGIDTGTTNPEQFEIVNDPDATSASDTFYIKDLVVWDGTGTANNDFLGPVKVYELTTVSDTSMPWSSTAADGYSVLDNNPPVDATAYISAPYPAMPAEAVFELSALPADVSSVKGIITRVRAGKSDGGDGQLQVSLRSNGVDDAGADRAITVAETYWSDVSELDPNTSAAWLPGAVDVAQLVLNRTV